MAFLSLHLVFLGERDLPAVRDAIAAILPPLNQREREPAVDESDRSQE